MSRKAQFYIFDAFFAAVILLGGLAYVSNQYVATPDHTQSVILSNEIATSLNADILQNIFTPYIIEYIDVIDTSLTPAQQIQQWWHNETCTDCIERMQNLTESILAPLETGTLNINISIQNATHNQTLYSLTRRTNEPEVTIVNTQLVISGTLNPELLYIEVSQ